MLGVIVDDIENRPMVPTFVMGDLNADPKGLQTIAEMEEEGEWYDIGKEVAWWGRPACVNTCHINAKAKETRIYAMLANQKTLEWIRDVQVVKGERVPTDKVLKREVAKGRKQKQRTVLKTLPSLKKLVDQKINEAADAVPKCEEGSEEEKTTAIAKVAEIRKGGKESADEDHGCFL